MSAFRLASLLDPHVHGVMTPGQLEEFRRLGWRVHRVGRAAGLHKGPRTLVMGVWAKRETPPDWYPRLRAYRRWWLGRGPAPAAERRRELAWLAARRLIRLRSRQSGRFVGRVPWWADVDAAGRLLTPRHLAPWRLT